jgi:phosphatidylglycerophosphatase A
MKRSVKSMMRRAALLIASCGGAGYFPVAPGTVGSAVGIVVDRLLRAALSPLLHGMAILAISWAGTVAATAVEKDLARKDPSVVVVDELAGMLLAVYLLPLSWFGLAVGFVLFRLFDIVKPYPCRQAERLSGGIGIMTDDLIAGVYTHVLLRLACFLWPAAMLEM